MSYLLWYFIVQLLISTPGPLSDYIYMCVCVCVFVYVYTHIYTYIYIYLHIYVSPSQQVHFLLDFEVSVLLLFLQHN